MNQLDLDFGVAAFSDYDEDGNLQIQPDSPSVEGGTGTYASWALTPLGLYSRPLDPEKDDGATVGLGCTLITVTAGSDRFQIPFNDPREASKLPKVKKGGAMLAGGAGGYRSFISIDGLDPAGTQSSGSIQLVASYNADDAKKSMAIAMNVRTPGAEELSLIHGEGQRLTMSATGKRAISLVSANGKAYAQVGDDGVSFGGPTKVQGSLAVGQIPAALPVAMADPVVAAIELLSEVLTAVGTAASAALGAQAAGPALIPLQSLSAITAKIRAQHLTST